MSKKPQDEITRPPDKIVSKPFRDSFWNLCFWEVLEQAKAQGHDTIVFEDVDKVVIEKSQQSIEELRKFIGC